MSYHKLVSDKRVKSQNCFSIHLTLKFYTVFQCKQFRIVVSFAMSIDKCQGQCLINVGIYLPESIFSHDQLYVFTSRT